MTDGCWRAYLVKSEQAWFLSNFSPFFAFMPLSICPRPFLKTFRGQANGVFVLVTVTSEQHVRSARKGVSSNNCETRWCAGQLCMLIKQPKHHIHILHTHQQHCSVKRDARDHLKFLPNPQVPSVCVSSSMFLLLRRSLVLNLSLQEILYLRCVS